MIVHGPSELSYHSVLFAVILLTIVTLFANIVITTNHVTFTDRLFDVWPSGQYFGDGSGGEFTSYPSLIRCGTGLVCYDASCSYVFGAHTPLFGEVQTVFRAEMLASFLVVKHVGYEAEVTFFTDNLGVSNAYHKGVAKIHLCINQDLLRAIFPK